MSPSGTDVDAQVLELIRTRLNVDVADVDVDLIEAGLIDSLGLVMTIAVLEESFACELPLDDFDIDNFRSARRITEYLDATGVLGARYSWTEGTP
jgi:D-alanine--poly(phosphoribitol) ligase subunit 2